MDLDRFLHRIRYDDPLTVDAATLAALQRAFLESVPFENLSIGWGEPITLDLERHYDKIVARGRGGFCFELNHLFAWALAAIGFEVGARSAAVWRDGAGYGDPASHLLLHVALDDPCIADVGFGENFRVPLPLVDGLCNQQGSHAYRLDRDRDDGRDHTSRDRWTLSTRFADGPWTPSYRFVDVDRPMDHFTAMCTFHQTSPLSHFTQKRVCSIATADGRLTLSGTEWIETDLQGERRVTTVTEAEAVDLLRLRFGIVAPS